MVRVFDRHSDRAGAYRIIRLENPQRANCLSIEAMELVQRAVREALAPVVLLAAQGRSFCSGLDLGEILKRGTPVAHLLGLRDLMYVIEQSDATTVSVVEGTTVAGGIALACCTDLAFARAGVQFKIPSATAYAPMVAVLKALVKAYRPETDFDALIGGQPVGRSPSFIDGTIPMMEADAIEWALRTVDPRAPAKRRTSETKRREIDVALREALVDDAIDTLLNELKDATERR